VRQARSTCLVGLDLAQREDFTAVAITEKVRTATTGPELHVRYLNRVQGISYPAVANLVADIMAWPALRGARLLVDATGVGRAVVDLMRDRGLPVEAVVITSGLEPTSTYNEHHVPKRDLVAALQVLLQTGRLKVSTEIPEGAAFAQELGNFAVSISPAGHDSYGAARAGHDDLVIAVSLAAWAANQSGDADAWIDYIRHLAHPREDTDPPVNR
jgi:hypothetical protein